ncbi:MAG TPA: CHAT domain-containing protein, partial [Bryobacteraceae bacterium]|nr:CHAT domain-containing protein [Bryobacteraceae bacterium]
MLQSGHLAEAQSRAEHAQALFTDSAWLARFRIEEAKILLYRGQSPEAIQLLSGSWIQKITSRELVVDRLLILALADSRTGNKLEAKTSVAEAESLCDGAHPVPSRKGELWLTEGLLAFEEDRPQEAEAFFKKSRVAARTTRNQFLEARSSIGLSIASLQQYHYEDAIAQSQAASDIADKIGAQQILIAAQGNAGWAYYQTGDYARALASFNDAAASASVLGSTSDEEHWLITAGMSEARLGNLDAARQRFDQSLMLARSLKNTSEITYADQALASLLLHSSHPERAGAYIDEARNLSRLTKDPSDVQLGNLLEAQLLAQQGNNPKAETLLVDVERSTKEFPTVLLEAQHTLAQVCDKAGEYQQAESWFQRSIATYHSQRSELRSDDARLPFSQNGHDLYMDYVAYLVRNHRTDEALEVIDQGRAETLAEGLGFQDKHASTPLQRISLTALARRSHAVILVYAMSQQVSYLWAANDKESSFYLLPNRATILTAVASHRRSVLAARDLVAEQHPAARNLYEMLVKPAEHLVHPGDRVFIVAGGLNGLNFETLLTPGKSSHYWIEDVTVTHLASVRLLASAHRQRPVHSSAAHRSQLLVIGNPVYSEQQYAALPNAAAEISDVAAHFPDNARTILTGMNASPGAYIQSNPARFDYIHFVSHATASR